MPSGRTKSSDYRSLAPLVKRGGSDQHDLTTLRPPVSPSNDAPVELSHPGEDAGVQTFPSAQHPVPRTAGRTEISFPEPPAPEHEAELPYAEALKLKKRRNREEADRNLLGGDNWLARNGHTFSYAGLFIFTVLVLFRPYELVPGLGFLSATAFYFAAATLLIYVPTQFVTEGNLSHLSTEVKAVLTMTFIALLTVPIAKDSGMAWETFSDTFIKAVLMFVVMVNVLRTRQRLMGMVWLSLSIGVVLSYFALGMYMRGEMTVERYRVGGSIKGMFENPNEMSMHLVMMFPIAVTLAIATRSAVMRGVYLLTAIVLISGNMITFSRGGFLGLIAAAAVLVWKLGRKNRVQVTAVSLVSGLLVLLLAPGNYALRILSIFGLAADPVGSSGQRQELLIRSLLVTARNPWGIGIGNFPIVGIQNLVTHNAYTQVSAEIGLLGLAAYMVFMISPFRKLGAIERVLWSKGETGWYYYLSIGFQASVVAFLVSSFFASVAYNWYIYYLIAYVVAFRRIYTLEKGEPEQTKQNGRVWRTA